MNHRGLARAARVGVLVATGLLAALQLVRPPLTNPPVPSPVVAAPEIAETLRASCYDCHSNETQLRWFDQVEPAYWLVAKDVFAARGRLNFSEIGAAPLNTQRAALFESLNQVRVGAMPPARNLILHPSARVGAVQLDAWERAFNPAHDAGPSVDAALRFPKTVRQVAAAPNGLAFVKSGAGDDGNEGYAYEAFDASSGKRITPADASATASRIRDIAGTR